jgi:hypothetical protein
LQEAKLGEQIPDRQRHGELENKNGDGDERQGNPPSAIEECGAALQR